MVIVAFAFTLMVASDWMLTVLDPSMLMGAWDVMLRVVLALMFRSDSDVMSIPFACSFILPVQTIVMLLSELLMVMLFPPVLSITSTFSLPSVSSRRIRWPLRE